MRGDLPEGWDQDLPSWPAGAAVATRDAGGKVMNAIAKHLPELIGGDADLSCSTKTTLVGEGSFDGASGAGRNLHFGVREHAMAAIANGMAYHGGVRPFTATFLAFSDYMRPAIRLAAMSRLPVLFIFTHDSIGLGEDGPTHQPVEQAMALRAIPNLHVIRPSDANETREAWRMAILRRDGPTLLLLTRQKVPTHGLDVSLAARGGYVLAEASGGEPRVLLLATGSEVEIALAAREILEREGIPARVVSMPCWEVFAREEEAYRAFVLPPHIRARLAIEAGVTLGWERWVGSGGKILGLDAFGASAPYETIYEKVGLTAERAARLARDLVEVSAPEPA
jgi:transketolase